MKKKILITGGSGFLGRSLAKKLNKKYTVYLGSRNNSNNYEAAEECKVNFVPLDVSNINSIYDAIDLTKPEIIIHAAATKFVGLSEEYPYECIDTNILGSSNLARASINKKIKIVVGISTDKAAQPIENLYGMSKATMEKIFISSNNISNTKFTCLRFGNIAWSTGSVFPIWKRMHEKNKIINTTGPFMTRFFFTSDEAANFVILSIDKIKKFSGKIVCPEMKSIQILAILKRWIKRRGGKYKIVKRRIGDKDHETLIGQNEINNTYFQLFNKKKYFFIDTKKNINLKFLKSELNSQNSKRMGISEIDKLINY